MDANNSLLASFENTKRGRYIRPNKVDFEQVTPATFNLFLFSSSFRVSAPLKFVYVILSFGCMILLLWEHIFNIYLDLFNCLIFVNIIVVNCHTFCSFFRWFNSLLFDVAAKIVFSLSITICGCLKCSWWSSGSFGFCQPID